MPPDQKSIRPEQDVKLEARQLRSLGSELRFRLFHLLVQQEASMADAAIALNVPEKSLYYHLRILLSVGIVKQTGARSIGKKPQKLYRAIAEGFSLNADLNDPEQLDASIRNSEAILRATMREYRQNLEERVDERFILRRRFKIDPAKTEDFRQKLFAIYKEFEVDGDKATDYVITSVLSRVTPRRS